MKKHLNREERREIGHYRGRFYGIRRIAQLMGRSVSTISDEIRRNQVRGAYDPVKAHEKARTRRRYSKYQGMKVIGDRRLRAYIHEKIQNDWSPELVSGRIREQDNGLAAISAKGIYRYIHSPYGRRLELHLPYGRRKHGARPRAVSGIANRMFIEERNKIVEKRLRFGDYEADFIESGRNGSGYLLVLVERKSRFVQIRKISQKTETLVFEALQELLMGDSERHSLTLDNDIVFRNHERLSEQLGIPLYFCHPYHSWEKGQVEQVNKLIRRYIPKGSDVARYKEEYVQTIEDKLNARPRKCLQFKTPGETLREWVQKRTVNNIVVPIKKDPVGCSV